MIDNRIVPEFGYGLQDCHISPNFKFKLAKTTISDSAVSRPTMTISNSTHQQSDSMRTETCESQKHLDEFSLWDVELPYVRRYGT